VIDVQNMRADVMATLIKAGKVCAIEESHGEFYLYDQPLAHRPPLPAANVSPEAVETWEAEHCVGYCYFGFLELIDALCAAQGIEFAEADDDG